MESKLKTQPNKIQLQAKILLAKAIIKTWPKANEPEKKEIEKWWKQTYGEFKKT